MSLTKLLADRRLWIVLGLVGAFLALRASGLTDYLSLDALRTHRTVLVDWVAKNQVLAALAFVGAYVVVVTFSLPGATIMTLTGGFLFGPWLGTALNVVGASTGATLVFLFAKQILGESALDKFGESARKIGDGLRRNAFSYLLVMRLIPLFPFFLVNLVPAFVGVRLMTYVIATVVGIIPGTTVFTLSGAGLGSVLDQGGTIAVSSILTPEVIAALVALAALSLITIPIKKRLARDAAPTPETPARG